MASFADILSVQDVEAHTCLCDLARARDWVAAGATDIARTDLLSHWPRQSAILPTNDKEKKEAARLAPGSLIESPEMASLSGSSGKQSRLHASRHRRCYWA